jgi:hypothetical protein
MADDWRGQCSPWKEPLGSKATSLANDYIIIKTAAVNSCTLQKWIYIYIYINT